MVFNDLLEGSEFSAQLRNFTLLEHTPTGSAKRPQQRKYALAAISAAVCIHTHI